MKLFTVDIPGEENRKYDLTHYSSGEMHLQFKPDELKFLEQADQIQVIVHQTDPLMKLALLTDAIDRVNQHAQRILILPYLPYSHMNEPTLGSCHGMLTFAHLINSLSYDHVITIDAHTTAVKGYINNLHDISPEPIIKEIITSISGIVTVLHTDTIKRYFGQYPESSFHPLSIRNKVLHCKKNRDVDDKLIDITVPSEEDFGNSSAVLIVDDICDEGKTFIEIAKKIHGYNLDVYLYVTHGVFSEGVEELGKHFQRIYTTDSYHGSFGHSSYGVSVATIPLHGIVKKAISEIPTTSGVCIK